MYLYVLVCFDNPCRGPCDVWSWERERGGSHWMMDVKCDSTHVSCWESLDTYQLAGDAPCVEKSLETVAVWFLISKCRLQIVIWKVYMHIYHCIVSYAIVWFMVHVPAGPGPQLLARGRFRASPSRRCTSQGALLSTWPNCRTMEKKSSLTLSWWVLWALETFLDPWVKEGEIPVFFTFVCWKGHDRKSQVLAFKTNAEVDLDEAQVVLTTVLGFFDPGAKGTAQTHWSHMTGWLKAVDKTCWSKFAQAIATAWRWQDRMGLFVFLCDLEVEATAAWSREFTTMVRNMEFHPKLGMSCRSTTNWFWKVPIPWIC